METEDKRIHRVYAEYAVTGARHRWDPRNPGNQAIKRERERDHLLETVLRERCGLGATFRVLDLGCGAGNNLGLLCQWGAVSENLFGVDLIKDRINEGRKLWPQLNLQQGDGTHLEFEDSSFDLVMVFSLFSSVLDPDITLRIASEMRRVLKMGGKIIWYDLRFNNPYNRNVIGYGPADIALLFRAFNVELTSITVLPPLVRRLGRLAPAFYPLLSRVSFLHSHYLGVLTRYA